MSSSRVARRLCALRSSWSALTLGAVLLAASPTRVEPRTIREFQPFTVDGITAEFARGVWHTPGYGRIVQVKEDDVTLFHRAAGMCLKDPTSSEDLMVVIALARPVGEDLEVATTPRSAPYRAKRLAVLPPECQQPIANDPLTTFEYFADVMQQHYAFFDLYDVDWPARVEAARARVSGTTTEAALFDLFSNMLTGLDDSHLSLVGEVEGVERVFSPVEPSPLRQMLDNAFTQQKRFKDDRKFRQAWLQSYFRNIRKKLLKGAESELDRAIIWGRIKGTDIGYFHILQMSGYSATGQPIDGQRHVERTMNRALADLQGVTAIIVDVSFNIGGADEISATFASHFAPREALAYTKRPFRQEAKEFIQAMRVRPSEGRRFEGPVTLVTSPNTVSAGETFVMYMRALPNVTHIGTSTAGALSDILDKPLPNGWSVGLSNEIYLEADGTLWEGKGIEPAHELEVFDDTEDIFESHWKAIRDFARTLQ